MTELLTEKKPTHISFSELSTYNQCGWKHKVYYKDKAIPFESSIFTEFGKAVHSAIEDFHTPGEEEKKPVEFFTKELVRLFSQLPDDKFAGSKKSPGTPETPEQLQKNREATLQTFTDQGIAILNEYFPTMQKFFGKYEVVSVEERLYENFDAEAARHFKGFIDMVIRLEDGTYCILDTKTTSWGWDARKKTDKMTTYQLTYYKNFFSEKHKIPLDNIKTYFILLKRTVKSDRVEIVEVPCGKIKIKNSLELLRETSMNIERNITLKNRRSCEPEGGFACPLLRTKWCK